MWYSYGNQPKNRNLLNRKKITRFTSFGQVTHRTLEKFDINMFFSDKPESTHLTRAGPAIRVILSSNGGISEPSYL
jgi:hypothetical protein